MRTHVIEATNNQLNWGKFLLGVMDTEWTRVPATPGCETGRPLLEQRGWDRGRDVFVMDLQTREGAVFALGGHAPADLDKHKIWVCPLFEPFLTWLYAQPLADVLAFNLPEWIDLKHVETVELRGYRRPGPKVEREIVHALWHGSTLCGMRAPVVWPAGHSWASREDMERVTCEDCLLAAKAGK